VGISPRSSSVASGSDRRVFDIFSDNLKHRCRDELLLDEVLKGQT
jgi:hypothetical protein